jgi:hypothetical protein
MDGILMMQGDGLKEGSTLFNRNIMDIAPTVLYLLGLSIAPDMDGTVLKEAIEQEVLEQNPIQMGDTAAIHVASSQVYTKDEEEELKAHLKSLGYFE